MRLKDEEKILSEVRIIFFKMTGYSYAGIGGIIKTKCIALFNIQVKPVLFPLFHQFHSSVLYSVCDKALLLSGSA